MSANRFLYVAELEEPERRSSVDATVHEVPAVRRNRRLLDKEPGFRKVSDLLRGPSICRHAVDVQMVRLEVEPSAIRRVEEVLDSIVAFRQSDRLPASCRHSPELRRAARV